MHLRPESPWQEWKDGFATCRAIWNPTTARFRPECLPIVSIVPPAVAVVIFTCYGLRPFLKRRPLWLRVFASEAEEKSHSIQPARISPWTSLLAIVSIVGVILSVVAAALPPWSPTSLISTIPWVIASVIVLIWRLDSTPPLLIILFSLLLAGPLIRLSSENLASDARGLLIAESCMAGAALTVAHVMPMRPSHMKTQGISPPFRSPNYYLRSPEDNLSLWQWISVTWMSPLIALGYRRQLHDEDVWKLPFEFQHERLHLLFQELRGSVMRRLFAANGLDLIITTSLGLFEMISKFATPLLLQQLLRALENDHAPRKAAYVYAAIILAVRCLHAQSSVFSLWYCRRCYERSRGEMVTMIYEKTLSRKVVGFLDDKTKVNDDDDAVKSGKPNKESASMGKILNLLRNDVYEVAQRFWEFPDLFVKPLTLIVSVVLVWTVMGWSCLIGALTLLLAQFLNVYIIRERLRWERLRRAATDIKLQMTSQFIEAIRHLRWYDWQNPWLEGILKSRQDELRLRIITGLWHMAFDLTNQLAVNTFPVTAFWAYTKLAGQPLRVDVAFPALQIFNMLAHSMRQMPGLVDVLLNARVAMGRIEDFMNEPNKDELSLGMRSTDLSIEFVDASFAWPGQPTTVLQHVNIKFPPGFSLICGKVGGGKSALMQAILGELDKKGGEVLIPDEMIGYCAQTPWLQSMSIRENILFSAPYEEQRYKQVLEACALIPDLANFKHGDLSNLGENGVGLSGGQRARVALARAVYSHARILLLDDPIAALDHDTAAQIVRRLFRGPLLKDRTVLLITHRLELCTDLVTQIVDIRDGQAYALNTQEFAMDMGGLQRTLSGPDEDSTVREEQEAAAVPDKFIEDEYRAHGGVVFPVYWQYIKSGKLRWWAVMAVIAVFWRLAKVGTFWLLKEWSEGYQEADVSPTGVFDRLPPPAVNVTPWLVAYLVLVMLLIFFRILTDGIVLVIVYVSGRRLFDNVMTRVSQAKFRFYDVTPVGRLMNRLTSDFSVLDGGLGYKLQDVSWYVISVISAMTIIASIAPIFLAFSVVLSGWFIYIFLRFLPTSQSLRRLETISLSPLMSNFGALLEGLTTVRAFRAQPHFQARVIQVVDAFQKMDHFYWSLQTWIMFRFDCLSALSTFMMTVMALVSGLTPGLTAFLLTAAGNLVSSTHALCRYYGNLQMDFVSVERVVELLDLEPEPQGTVSPPASWPTTTDDIVFDHVTIRYAEHLDPALQDISLRIPAGRTTAIIGRTGSGKSTLVLSLLATVRPDSSPDNNNNGSIHIGTTNLSTVNVHALRQRITFVAQDPVLFAGSMRSNLDPESTHSDTDCANVLARVLGDEWSLSAHVEGGGRNLSQGQRQLVGLARAILRRSALVLLDEATASIDRETAARMQDVMRDELKESTVVTVAHRVEAVKDADWCILLDKGRVVMEGPAEAVLEREFGATTAAE